ncbi:hypothetical protein M3Y94_00439500 [Aphelenchoides besseyi]|nr:hypothetical protein M3Y94_00439500 [Aphelenchoides besseyi]KAI6229409.1 hypothetical protein M3Y95_00528100 [Aphelenchoides besseyi]
MSTDSSATKSNGAFLDSWEDDDDDLDLSKISEAFSKAKISQTNGDTRDPLSEKKTKKTGFNSNDEVAHSRLKHLLVLSGTSINADNVLARLVQDFGETVQMRRIDSFAYVLVFANIMDARHTLQNAHKFAPMKLNNSNEVEKQHLDFIVEHEQELRPKRVQIRPATNMSVIRRTVTRTLNIRDPTSAQQRKQEKEQIEKARKLQKANADIWK